MKLSEKRPAYLGISRRCVCVGRWLWKGHSLWVHGGVGRGLDGVGRLGGILSCKKEENSTQGRKKARQDADELFGWLVGFFFRKPRFLIIT